jgi:hypothetical protein
VFERVRCDRHLEALVRLERKAEQMTGKHVGGTALVSGDVEARECLADILVGDDLAGGVEPDLAAIDRGRTLGIPGDALVAHVLHPHRPAEMLRQHGGVRGGVALVVAAVAAGAEHPDRSHLFTGQAEQLGDALGRIMRVDQ